MANELADLVDHERGLVSRAIFAEEGIYRLERARIFGRCWLFLAHESQIPAPGDFVTTHMGEEPVIVVRAADGRIHALRNRCPGCGGCVCAAEAGRGERFRCRRHAWRFSLAGCLLDEGEGDFPGAAAAGRRRLSPVARVDGYKGCVFGAFAADAPPLADFLGDICWGLDLLLEQGPLAVVGVARWIVNCNWKFAAESSVNEIGDAAAGARAAAQDARRSGFTVITAYGHGLNAEVDDGEAHAADDALDRWRTNPEARGRLGSFRMKIRRACVTIFPNVVVSTATRRLYVWRPRGPRQMEAMMLAFADMSEPPEARRAFARAVQRLSGPAGVLGHAGEPWEQATALCRTLGARHIPLNFQMGLGHGELIDDEQSPPRIETLVNEHRQLWFYRNWARALAAPGGQAWQAAWLPLPARV